MVLFLFWNGRNFPKLKSQNADCLAHSKHKNAKKCQKFNKKMKQMTFLVLKNEINDRFLQVFYKCSSFPTSYFFFFFSVAAFISLSKKR